MKKIIKNALILTIITLVAGTALAFVYSITKKPIENVEKDITANAYKEVFKQADSFSALNVSDYSDENNSKIIAVSKALSNGKTQGYVMTAASKGYGGDIKIAVGISNNGEITGISVLDASNETPGLGAKCKDDDFTSQFKGLVKENIDSDVDAISGATYSTNGVKNAVFAGLKYFENNLQKGGNS